MSHIACRTWWPHLQWQVDVRAAIPLTLFTHRVLQVYLAEYFATARESSYRQSYTNFLESRYGIPWIIVPLGHLLAANPAYNLIDVTPNCAVYVNYIQEPCNRCVIMKRGLLSNLPSGRLQWNGLWVHKVSFFGSILALLGNKHHEDRQKQQIIENYKIPMEDYATSATSIDCTEYESKPKTKQNTKESDITKMQSGNGIKLSISEKGLKATSLLPSIQKYSSRPTTSPAPRWPQSPCPQPNIACPKSGTNSVLLPRRNVSSWSTSQIAK